MGGFSGFRHCAGTGIDERESAAADFTESGDGHRIGARFGLLVGALIAGSYLAGSRSRDAGGHGGGAFTVRFDAMPVRTDTGVLLAEDGINSVVLPGFIGTEWIGRRTEVSSVEREILPPDTGFSRRLYVALDNPQQQVFLSIVLSGRDRSSIHQPELCVEGQGWTIKQSFTHQFDTPLTDSGRLSATVLRVERVAGDGQTVPSLLVYWFVNGERVVPSQLQRMVRGGWDRLRHGRADRWAYMLAQTDASDGEALALARLQEVLDGTLPRFQKPAVGGR